MEGYGKNIRVYSTKRELNLLSLLDGTFPEAENEIALDRMFAVNNEIEVGDRIVVRDRELMVTGYVASPDYSSLFESNTDMMFDSINFSIAAMSENGFKAFDSARLTFNYGWLYPKFIEREDMTTAKKMSDDLINIFEDEITDNMVLTDYLPRYLNQAINFVGKDMGGDKIIFVLFDYILTVVLAFVFAITVSNTITTESAVIGTLRASGYTRGELLSHYIVIPVLVTFMAAVMGNILGYTVFSNIFVDFYYDSYSLSAYEKLWSGEAFLLTTVIPLLIMFAINIFVIARRLHFSPLKLIRRDLSKNKKKKALNLNNRISFINRFRIRIILQNMPGYITMFFGIMIGGVLIVFGTMFGPLLSDYKKLIINDRICDYQYVLKTPAETVDEKAEKYTMTTLKTTDKRYMEDEISIYGIAEKSSYVKAEIVNGNVAVSNVMAEKFGLSIGDSVTLKDPYNDKKTYEFNLGSIYEYNTGLTVFMTKNDYCEVFGEGEDYFTGYFSDRKLTDIDDRMIALVVTVSDLTKVSDQLTVSMGEMMELFKWLGVIVFIMLMFIMSKQIIEKNATSISMTKILGFSNVEISRLYIIATSVVVVLSLLLTIPLIEGVIRILFEMLVYTRMTGYIPFTISKDCFLQMFTLGVLSYVLIAITQMYRIKRIPKNDALKNVE